MHQDPTRKIFHDNYLTVRSRLASVTRWIGDRISDLFDGRAPNPEKTFAYRWIRNGGDGEYFTRKDAIAEVVHDLMAFNQWGSTIYKIMLKLGSGDWRNP